MFSTFILRLNGSDYTTTNSYIYRWFKPDDKNPYIGCWFKPHDRYTTKIHISVVGSNLTTDIQNSAHGTILEFGLIINIGIIKKQQKQTN